MCKQYLSFQAFGTVHSLCQDIKISISSSIDILFKLGDSNVLHKMGVSSFDFSS